MLRADLHVHTHFSHDCRVRPERLVARCQEKGINCLAVTDHNTLAGALVVREITPFTVIVGEEVWSTEGDIIGLFLQEEIPRGLSPLQVAQNIKEQGGLVMVPHPYDPFRSSVITRQGLQEILPHVDIMETFNARNLRARDNERAYRLALEHGLLVAAVSDAHTLREIGSAYMEMPQFDGTPQGFKEALAQGRMVGSRSRFWVRLTTTYNKLHKRLFGGP